MNGNVTREGITADLEAMSAVGIGGAQIFNVDCGIPAGPVKTLSPEWRDLVRHAAAEANRLGLELCLHNCAGWSSSGGPWNTPEHAMQRVTMSEMKVTGPKRFSGLLPRPPAQLGYYRDIAVLAFRAPGAGKRKLSAPKFADEARAPLPPGELAARRPLQIDNIQAKGGFNGEFVLSSRVTNTAPGTAVRRSEIVDLTSCLRPDGRLEWKVPAGEWIILRLGHTPTGKDNHPAPADATGPECDKFDPAALDAHWAGYVQKVIDDLGPLAGPGKTFNNVLIDSYEVGGQNWTPRFRAEFQNLRGYDPLLFLPTLTGRVVDSPEISERFLWDMRRTIADLFARNYYGHFRELCHQHGLQASIEPYTGPFDSLQCGEPADIPMGEFWVGGQPGSSIKLAASVGHIYGRPVIGAESFTAAPGTKHGRWLEDPASIKALGDRVFCEGINRFIFHRYAMQPWTNRWPGMTMGQWGTHFDRTCTWFEQGRAWLQYVARCQYLLQQGRFVADAAYFCGESAPVELRAGNPSLPPGYDYDAINAEVLLRQATMRDRRLTLPSGASYRMLILPPSDRSLTPELLGKLAGFVAEGLTLVGAPPQASPSLANYPKCDAEVRDLAARMWADCDGQKVREHAFGKGSVVWGRPLAEVLVGIDLKPDFEVVDSDQARLAFIHRRVGGAEVYFVSNQRAGAGSVECRFRVDGLAPELWNPETGGIRPAPVWRAERGRTVVALTLEPAGSVFVVFRALPSGDHLVAAETEAVADGEPAPKRVELRIIKALYGVFPTHSKGSVDVTDKLAARVKDGRVSVRIDNALAGGDPAYLIPKELRVDYLLDGLPRHAIVAENEDLTLPQTAVSPVAPPPFGFAAGSDVQDRLLAWEPRSIRLRWASGKETKIESGPVPAPVELEGAWEVRFPAGWGAPEQVVFDHLQSWPDRSETGVKYFSGTATYLKEFELPPGLAGSARELWLDLGVVKNLAEVSLNGQALGILWKAPFRVEVTGAVKPGKNRLEIKVTNLWPNRLIGDEQLPPDCEWVGKRLKAWPQWLLDGKPSPAGRLTFTTWHHWTKDDALLDSGLLGPVTLRAVETFKYR